MSLTLEARRQYCADAFVQRRVREFFGQKARGSPSAMYLTAGTESASLHREPLPIEELGSWLGQGAELSRSMWDRKSLICHLDLEYVNFDAPSYPYANSERVFDLQKPVITATVEILKSFSVLPLIIVTGRGYHLVWSIRQDSKAFAELSVAGHLGSSLRHLYATVEAPTGECVAPELGAAFAGLGLVMEFLAHEVKLRAAASCAVPVELGAIETGGGEFGREMISIDITEYADPLTSRVMRAPFTVYLKPSQQGLGGDGREKLPPIFAIPLAGMPIRDALRIRSDPALVLELARSFGTQIPDASAAMKGLVKAYLRSRLAKFHAEFYAEEHDAPGLWPETYDRTPLEMMPPCARVILERPNDLLLRPGCVQRVVRVMLSLGWHPRHIAGLIRSKYERNHGWKDQWDGFDAATRADFYARVFSGLFVAGTDDLVDFNCQSAREEGICYVAQCSENLENYRNSLIDRRNYERLACRPFNRLFLPAEHI